MNVICPKCRHSIPVEIKNPVVKCRRCNFSLNRLKIGLSPSMLQAPLVRDLRGEKVGPYRVEKLIGQGGSGATYMAETEEGLPRAFKALHYDQLRKSDFISRFKGTARDISRLHHPHIARVLDFGQADDLFFVVSEFIEGVTLSHYLKSFSLEPGEARNYMAQIAAGVAHAHAQGAVHGNLKPDNVMIASSGVKILDFGLAGLTTGDYRRAALVPCGPAMASYRYMCPLQTDKDDGGRSADVYSLGVLYYRMLTGRLPQGLAPAPSRYGRGADRRDDEIVRRCLTPDAARRYESAEPLAEDLERLRHKRPRAVGRTPFRLVLVLLAFLSVMLYLWPHWDLLWGLRPDQPHRAAAQPGLRHQVAPPAEAAGR